LKKLGAHMESTQSRVQSESVTARRPVDDLDSIGKYLFIYFYFYGYGALLHYDLERHTEGIARRNYEK